MKWLYSVVCKGVSLQHTTSTIYTIAMLSKADKAFKKRGKNYFRNYKVTLYNKINSIKSAVSINVYNAEQ